MALPFLSAAALWAPASLKLPLMGLAFGKALWNGACVGGIIAHFFPVRANQEELRGRNILGWAVRLKWDEITKVEKINWWGAPYVRLSSARRKRCLWLPLFLSEQSEFEALARQNTAETHPLRAFFEAHEPNL